MKHRNKYFFTTLILLFSLMTCGCHKQTPYRSETSWNFYKDSYSPEISHKEEDLELDPQCQTIKLLGQTTSGTYHLEIIDKDQKDVKYVYDINKKIASTISIKDEQRHDQWIAQIDVTEDTEGSLNLIFSGE